MNKQPVCYLDIDGVLNPLKTLENRWAPWENLRDAYRSEKLLTTLWKLPIKIVWVTDRETDANRFYLAGTNLEEKPVLKWKPGYHNVLWKQQAILENHPKNTPLIWVDDTIAVYKKRQQTQHAELTKFAALLVNPNPDAGLTDNDIEKMGRWIQKQNRPLKTI